MTGRDRLARHHRLRGAHVVAHPLRAEVTAMTTTTLTFTIPPTLWLTSNRAPNNRGHRSRQVGDLQDIAIMIARVQGAKPIVDRFAVDWTVCYPKGVSLGAGDPANAHPTTKALLDGLVRARLLEDDSPRFVVYERYWRGPNLTVASLHEIRLTLTPQDIPWLDPTDQNLPRLLAWTRNNDQPDLFGVDA